jgi:hypothetical protein
VIRTPLLVVLACIVLSCGHAQRAATVPELDPRRDRIAELEARIAAAHEQLATGAAAGACADVCRLADEICRASEDICRLAAELGDDSWARGRCDEGTASCQQARERCTSCR